MKIMDREPVKIPLVEGRVPHETQAYGLGPEENAW
jgi:hypothetical protein